jgi:pimeloyl-ACP methyl ester carboxylesterase
MLAPRIHAMGGDYAGIILFAGSPRFLLDIMKDQQTIFAATMPDGPEKDEMIEANKQITDRMEEGLLLSDEEARKIMPEEMGGISAYYFKDMYENPPSKYIANISAPFLVMHAAEDLQVYIDKDFELYKELLSGHNNATFKLYEGLNHLFMPAKTKNIAEILNEYKIKANIDVQVLIDIAEWIKVKQP